MSIAFAEVQSGNQTATGTSVATASLGAGGSDSLYVALISTRSNAAVSSLSGLGLTWNSLKAQCAWRAQQRIEAYYAYGAGSSGAVTANHASSPVSLLSVLRLTGVESSEPVEQALSWNTQGLSGGCTGTNSADDNDDAGPWTDLNTVHANSWVLYAVNSRNRTLTSHTSGWDGRVTNYSAGSGGNITTHSIETKLVASAGNVTNGAANNLSGAADHCEIAIEIRETVSGGGVLVPQIVANYRRNRAA